MPKINQKSLEESPLDLSENQQQAVLLLSSGKTGREVAQQLGIYEGTVSRWRQMPKFQAALKAIRDDIQRTHIDQNSALIGSVLATLQHALTSQDLELTERVALSLKLLQHMASTPFLSA